MATSQYKFYMARYEGDDFQAEQSIEDVFEGLRVATVKGLSDKGKPRIYTETYAEIDGTDVYIPEDIKRDSTEIEFEILFMGDGYRDVYDSFVDFITGAKIRYRDTCRNRQLDMVLNDSIEVSDEMLYGGQPFVMASFKFLNLAGHTTKVG